MPRLYQKLLRVQDAPLFVDFQVTIPPVYIMDALVGSTVRQRSYHPWFAEPLPSGVPSRILGVVDCVENVSPASIDLYKPLKVPSGEAKSKLNA